MQHSDAQLSSQGLRGERNLRIVHSIDLPASGPVKPRRPVFAGPMEHEGSVTDPTSTIMPFPGNGNRGVILDRALQARIGGMLRDVFSDIDLAPVPDRFIKLLEKLEEKETSHE